MIIAVYKLMGKTTLAKKNSQYTDLDTKPFWIYHADNFTWKRDDNWVTAYCNLAQDFQSEGRDVLICCDVDILRTLWSRGEEIFVIIPEVSSREMESLLYNRSVAKHGRPKYLLRGDDKAEFHCRYKDELHHLIDLTRNRPCYRIKSPDYDLEQIIEEYKKGELKL